MDVLWDFVRKAIHYPHTCIEPPAPFSRPLAPIASNMFGLYANIFLHKVGTNEDSAI